MWNKIYKLIKDKGTIVLFGSEPFSSHLRMSNIKNYSYDWVWNKKKAGNIFLIKSQPLRVHENIIIFNGNKDTYNSQKTKRSTIKKSKNYGSGETMFGEHKSNKIYTYKDRHPISIIKVSNASQKNNLHPTQKPVRLLEYLVKTYSKENELVLDFTTGSGTTGVACLNNNRRFIGIEKEKKYCKIASQRLNEASQCFIFEGS